MITPSTTGRVYQAPCLLSDLGRQRIGQAASSASGRGRVTRLTTMVTTKQVLHAKMAVQKFWAISLG